MGNTVYHYKDYSYPDEYKVYNKDMTKYIVFTYATDIDRYVDGRAIYNISSVLPKTQTNIVLEVKKMEDRPPFTLQKRYRVVVVNETKHQCEEDEVFEDMLEATNYYVKMKAEMDLKCI